MTTKADIIRELADYPDDMQVKLLRHGAKYGSTVEADNIVFEEIPWTDTEHGESTKDNYLLIT